jgi:2-dehydropantoate 2-reductase
MSIITKNTEIRILVVGAGAVGGYFGGRLAQAGRDVTFLVRPKRAEQIRAQGLQILSARYGDFTVRPKVITAAQIASPYDVIFLSVKSYNLAGALDDFAPAVGPRTVVIPVLNGMRHIDVLTERFGKEAVLDGVCYVATEMDSYGRIIQLADFQSFNYGELDGKKTSRIEAVYQAFQGAGFDTAISGDILRDMWQKWVFWPAWEPSRVCSVEISERSRQSQVAPIYLFRRFANALQSPVLAAIRSRRHSRQQRALNSLHLLPR